MSDSTPASTDAATAASTPSATTAAPAAVHDPIRTLLEKAREEISRNALAEAAQTLNQAQRQRPGDARVFMMAGLMAEKSGNVAGAFDALRKCVALSPDWGPGLLELALLHARNNQFAQAIELAEKVARLEPRNPMVLAGVVDIATRGGYLDMAVAHLRRGLEVFPDDVQLQQYLARNLSTLGRWDEAIAQWDALIARQPADAMARLGRVQTLLAAGQPERAIDDTLALLEQEPGNSVFAYYNALAHGQTPAHQPPELSQELFDGMAEVYDLHVVRRLGYYLPREVAQQIKALHPEGEYHVLDLGCGTGLLGLYLGRIEGFLIGVDCSRQMVQQAKRHGVYDRFHTVNLHDALAETPAALYHVITALDVFIYAGALQQAIPNAHRILSPGGHFIFSCETAPEGGAELVLQTNGRYAHRRDHVEQLCRNAGFVRVDVEDVVLRKENDQPVHGFVITAHKAA